eukprot:GHRR01019932.1.p1 GENE.GHRR01019932.1~~GHRR01019932.1.p1  ORF type:complete len:174 (-),score=1.38 GHRR01019932.1:116-637(-)
MHMIPLVLLQSLAPKLCSAGILPEGALHTTRTWATSPATTMANNKLLISTIDCDTPTLPHQMKHEVAPLIPANHVVPYIAFQPNRNIAVQPCTLCLVQRCLSACVDGISRRISMTGRWVVCWVLLRSWLQSLRCALLVASQVTSNARLTLQTRIGSVFSKMCIPLPDNYQLIR